MRWLVVAFIAQKAATFASLFFLARYLGELDFGRFAIALSIPTALEAISDLGLSWALVREGAGRPEHARRLAAAALPPKLVLGALTVVLTFAVTSSLSLPAELVEVAILLAVAKALDSLTYLARAVFQAHERMEFDAAAQSLDAAVRLALTAYALLGGFGLIGLAKALVIAAAIVFVGTAAETIRRFLLPVRPAWHLLPGLFAAGVPLAVVWLLDSVTLRLGIVVSGQGLGGEAAGNVAAAIRLIEPLLAVPALMATALLPLTSRHLIEQRATVPWLFHSSVKMVVLGALAVSIVLFGSGPAIVALVFGAGFEQARDLIRLLAPAVVLLFVHALLVPLLLALRRQRALIVGQLAGVVVNLAVVSVALASGPGAVAIGLLMGETTVIAFAILTVRELRDFGVVGALRTAALGVLPAAMIVGVGPLGELPSTALALLALLLEIRLFKVVAQREIVYLEGVGPGFGRLSRLLLAPLR